MTVSAGGGDDDDDDDDDDTPSRYSTVVRYVVPVRCVIIPIDGCTCVL